MDSNQEIFADGIGTFRVIDGIVRFDFVTLQPSADGKSQTPVVCERIAMPLLRAFTSMQRFCDKCIEAGLVRKNEKNEQK